MYSLPSTSHTREPFALLTKKGSPPTPRKARTGEFTPPGMYSRASAKSFRDSLWATVFITLPCTLAPFTLHLLTFSLFPEKRLLQRSALRANHHAHADVILLEPALGRLQHELNIIGAGFHGS